MSKDVEYMTIEEAKKLGYIDDIESNANLDEIYEIIAVENGKTTLRNLADHNKIIEMEFDMYEIGTCFQF